nr:EntD [Salmonella enterica subsp. enterica serovar Typhimurium]
MLTSHFPLPFAGHRLHIVDFDASSFREHDLLWLPHHDRLRSAGRKRKAEHLAGRIAAVHALRRWASGVPGIGDKRQPLWPDGLFGSISHCATTALAVISRQRIGIDIEKIMSQHTATELAVIIDSDDAQILQASLLPFPLALTLAFSAKESVYKAFQTASRSRDSIAQKLPRLPPRTSRYICWPAFAATMAERTVRTEWFQRDNSVITLVSAITRVPHDRSAPASILSAIPR